MGKTVAFLRKCRRPGAEPFTVDIMIGNDGSARAVAGLNSTTIKYGGIRNIIQLVVVDLDSETKDIVAVEEARKTSDDDFDAELIIESLPFNKNYAFLILMGYWKHDGEYDYVEYGEEGFEPPTLLAAGLQEQKVLGSGIITVTTWPVVVDTAFKTSDGSKTAVSTVEEGKLKPVSLLPVGWKVTWTLKKGVFENGQDDLVRAQKAINADAGDALLLKGKKTIVNGETLQEYSDPITNAITLDISDYTSGIGKIGTSGSVNFNLEYVPFNMTEGSKWLTYKDKSKFDLAGTGEPPVGNAPVWIIRNGLNDAPQGEELLATLENGAVSFKVTEDISEDLEISDGKFLGLAAESTMSNISFVTTGYEGNAQVYYVVVEIPENEETTDEPEYSAYTQTFGAVAKTDAANPHVKQIQVVATKGYHVYLRLFKDGKVSGVYKIDTTAGGLGVDTVWGDSTIPINDPGSVEVAKRKGWEFSNNTVTITETGYYTITGTTVQNRVVVSSGVTASILLDDVNIDVSGVPNTCAFYMTDATVNLILAKDTENTLKSNGTAAGLMVPQDATLSITSEAGDGLESGRLIAYGQQNGSGARGAGIGGGTAASAGTITINGGAIEARGAYDSDGSGAGIGGGGARHDFSETGGSGGKITINGGKVTAYNSEDTSQNNESGGATIGGGGGHNETANTGGDGGEITIKGGTVTAVSKDGGAGIGSGFGAPSNSTTTIKIEGGAVTATASRLGAGIGGGYKGVGISINISGGIVRAYTPAGTGDPAAIGGGMSGYADVTISGGTVIAIGGTGPGIGGGNGQTGGSIAISGGTIIASNGGSGGIGIGAGNGYTATTITGKPVIFASQIQDGNASQTTRASDLTNGISARTDDVGISATGDPAPTAGSLTLNNVSGFTVPADATLTVPPGWTLNTNSKTFTNNGTIYSGAPNYGTIN